MKTFKQIITESKIPNGWTKPGGAIGIELKGQNNVSGIMSLVISLFGTATASGVGNANTNANVSANKFMNFNYGFSNSILQSFFKLNNKELTKLGDLIALMLKNGYSIDDEIYVVPFGRSGYLMYLKGENDFVFYDSTRTLMTDSEDIITKKEIAIIDKLK
jgi:hypothetical protein